VDVPFAGITRSTTELRGHDGVLVGCDFGPGSAPVVGFPCPGT